MRAQATHTIRSRVRSRSSSEPPRRSQRRPWTWDGITSGGGGGSDGIMAATLAMAFPLPQWSRRKQLKWARGAIIGVVGSRVHWGRRLGKWRCLWCFEGLRDGPGDDWAELETSAEVAALVWEWLAAFKDFAKSDYWAALHHSFDFRVSIKQRRCKERNVRRVPRLMSLNRGGSTPRVVCCAPTKA